MRTKIGGLVLGLAAIAALLIAAPDAEAHTNPTVSRDCTSVSLHNTGSDGTATITQQTGAVFTVGQTIAPGGTLTKPAAPNQSGSVHVTYSTDHGDFHVSWGTSSGCTPPTPPTTKPPVTTTTVHQDTTTTSQASSTSTVCQPGEPGTACAAPAPTTPATVAEPTAATPAFTG